RIPRVCDSVQLSASGYATDSASGEERPQDREGIERDDYHSGLGRHPRGDGPLQAGDTGGAGAARALRGALRFCGAPNRRAAHREGVMGLEEVYSLFRESYPYSTLSLETLKKLVTYMRERYPRLAFYSEAENRVSRARDIKPLFDYYFANLSMIPDEKQYLVVEGDRMVGALDEAFVSEYGEVGVKFVEGGRCWKIEQIYSDKIYVRAEDDPTGAVPNWVGDEIPVPLEVALEVGATRRGYAEAVAESSEAKFIKELVKTYPVSEETLRDALREVAEQR